MVANLIVSSRGEADERAEGILVGHLEEIQEVVRVVDDRLGRQTAVEGEPGTYVDILEVAESPVGA